MIVFLGAAGVTPQGRKADDPVIAPPKNRLTRCVIARTISVPSTSEILKMWVDLTDAEVAAVIAAMREGSVVDKLCTRPALGTGAFLEAANRKADDDIYVEDYGVVQRDAFGAYVMCWQWVSEKEAGVPTAYEPLGISCEIATRLKARRSFRLEGLEYPTNKKVEARGEYGGFSWLYEAFKSHWRLTFNDPNNLRHSWMFSERLPEDEYHSKDLMILSWLRAFDAFDQRGPDPAHKISVAFRAELEAFIYGDSSLASLKRFYVASPESILSYADFHRSTMAHAENGLLRSAGYGFLQPEIDTQSYPKMTGQCSSDSEKVPGVQDNSDMIFSADLKLCATMYIRAPSFRSAQKILDAYKMTGLVVSGHEIGEAQFTRDVPDVQIGESMTIYGEFDGCTLSPRYDLTNDFDFG